MSTYTLVLIIILSTLFSSCSHNSDSITSSDKTYPPPMDSFENIPLVVVIFEHGSFGGGKRFFVTNNNDLKSTSNWDNIGSSIKVYKGPDYNSYISEHGKEPSVTLYQYPNYSGSHLTLKAGGFSSLGALSFNDKTSSIKFNALDDGQTSAFIITSSFDEIHTVLHLYQNHDWEGYYIVILGTTMPEFDDLSNFFPIFKTNDFASSYIAYPGPNAAPGKGIVLYTEKDYNGAIIDVYGYNEDKNNFPTDANNTISSSESIN